MPSREIENPSNSDDYVDGLRRNPPATHAVPDSGGPSLLLPSEANAGSDKGVASPGRFMLRLVGIAAVFIAGVTVGTHRDQATSRNVANEPHGTAVTVTVTQASAVSTFMPPACKQVLTSIEKYLDLAAVITSVNGRQLDILAGAYQAIMKKDWKQLHELTERQLNLERSLSDPTYELMPQLPDIKKDLIECQHQSG